MDRTDVTPDPDDLLETALTDPGSFDAARTARLVAQLEHDDPEVRRAASWALRFVASERPSLVDGCTGRFRRALRDPESRSAVLRTLAVLAEHNREAVAEIVRGAVDAELIGGPVARRTVAGYQPSEPEPGGSVVADEGDETVPPTETAVVEEDGDRAESGPDYVSPSTPGHPPQEPPTKPPRLDRPLRGYEPETPPGGRDGSAAERIRFTEGGREFTATRRRAPSAEGVDEAAFLRAVDQWRRIDDHDAAARVVDAGTRPTPWLVAERGDPGSLAERATPVSAAEARWVLSRVADAVGYAHSAGVLHGGIRPGAIAFVNAVEDPDAWAFPRVGGWGLRGAFGPRTERSGVPRRYAAPEHVAPDRFGAVDAATDVYGLGVIGHVLLTGEPPARADGTAGPAREVADRVPDALSTVLTKSLAPSKMERYASAAAFKRDLLAGERDG